MLESYEKEAIKFIQHKKFKPTDELVGNIMNALIMADLKYDKKRGIKLNTYRHALANHHLQDFYHRAIKRNKCYQSYSKKEKNPIFNHEIVEDMESNKMSVEDLATYDEALDYIDKINVSPLDRQVAKEYFTSGISKAQLARDHNLSRNRIGQIIQNVVNKLKDKYGVSSSDIPD